MKISTTFSKTIDHVRVVIQRTPDEDDLEMQIEGRPSLGREEIFIDADQNFSPDETHNDILGLVCLLTVEPYCAKNVELDFPVSVGFANAFRKNFGKEIFPTSPDISQRQMAPDFKDALSFSGGADSCAVLHLLPVDTISFFLKMVHPDNGITGKYRAEAALYSCKAVEESGRRMVICPSTVEYGRKPTGFTVDWTPSVAAVLHADLFRLRSVSFGMIIESAFRLGGKEYTELSGRKGYRTWKAMFDYCSIPISLPTAGISEVLTSRISQGPASIWKPQSCVRGGIGVPCMKCLDSSFKCNV